MAQVKHIRYMDTTPANNDEALLLSSIIGQSSSSIPIVEYSQNMCINKSVRTKAYFILRQTNNNNF